MKSGTSSLPDCTWLCRTLQESARERVRKHQADPGIGELAFEMGAGWNEVHDMDPFPIDCRKTNRPEPVDLSECRPNVSETETGLGCLMVLCIAEDRLCSAS